MIAPSLILPLDELPAGGQLSGGLMLPGVAGFYAATPDSPAVSVTGPIDIRVHLHPVTWAPASPMRLVSKRNAGIAYDFYMDTGGDLAFYNGVQNLALGAGRVFPTDGAAGWVRMTFNTANGQFTLYKSADATNDYRAVNWTVWAGPVAATPTPLNDTADEVDIGTFANVTGWLNGTVLRAVILNGIDGPAAFDVDFTGWPAGLTAVRDNANNAAVSVNGGAMVRDASGNNRHGYPVNGVTLGAAGRPLRAAAFDGVNDYIRVSKWGMAAARTMTGWIKVAAAPGADVGIFGDSWGNSGGSVMLLQGATGKLKAQTATAAATASAVSAAAVTNGQWRFVAMSYDGATIRTYVDGVADATAAFAGGTAPTLDFMAGAVNSAAPASFMSGSLADLRVYAGALTAAEIRDVMSGGRQGTGSGGVFARRPGVKKRGSAGIFSAG